MSFDTIFVLANSGFFRILLTFSRCSVDREYCKTPACDIFILTLFSTISLTQSLLTSADCPPGIFELSKEDKRTLSRSSCISSITSSGFLPFSVFSVIAPILLIFGCKGKFSSLTPDSKAFCFSELFLTIYGSDNSNDFSEWISEDGTLFFPILNDVVDSLSRLIISVLANVRGFKSFC